MSDSPTVGEQLAVISYKLDALLAGKDDHEVRIRALEATNHQGIGLKGAVGYILALVPTVLWLLTLLR